MPPPPRRARCSRCPPLRRARRPSPPSLAPPRAAALHQGCASQADEILPQLDPSVPLDSLVSDWSPYADLEQSEGPSLELRPRAGL